MTYPSSSEQQKRLSGRLALWAEKGYGKEKQGTNVQLNIQTTLNTKRLLLVRSGLPVPSTGY